MYRELGLLLILLLGATLIYLLRSDDSQISSRSKKKKNKKKNKKATKVTATSEDINASVDDNLTNSTSSPATNAVPSFIMRRYQRQGTESSTSPATSDSLTKQPSTIDDTTIAPCKHQKEDTRNRHYSTNSQKHTPSRPSKKVDFPPLIAPTPKDTSSKKINEADKNMVSPTNYSRVLRIRTESSSPSKMSLGKARKLSLLCSLKGMTDMIYRNAAPGRTLDQETTRKSSPSY